MSSHVILALGMQGCFLSEGGSVFVGPEARDSLQRYLSSSCCAKNTVVYASALVRHADDPLFGNDLVSCLPGSVDASTDSLGVPSLVRVVHSRPDLTSQPHFKTDLMRRDIDFITVVGAETHGSVLHTAMSLSYLGYRVEVPVGLTFSRDNYLKESSLSLLSLTCGVTLL